MTDVNYRNIITPEQEEALALSDLRSKIAADAAKDRLQERLIEIEGLLTRNRGAEAYYEKHQVDLSGILKVAFLLRRYDYRTVIDAAMKLGTQISDHTLLLIDQVADILRRG